MASRVSPEGFAAAGASVAALTARLAAAHVGAAPLITVVVPAAAQAADELGRAGVGVGESGASYATGDAAASYLIVGG